MVTERCARFHRRWGALAMGLLLAALSLRAAERASGPAEYDVKAAFLFNFAKFVTWPAEAFASPEAPIAIGILGEDPFGEELARLSTGLRVQGRPLSVTRGANAAQLARCHVIFLSASERDRHAQLTAALRQLKSPALIVGDTDGFLDAGGMIRFVMEQNKVRFEISPEAAAAARLAISSKLLSLALNSRARP